MDIPADVLNELKCSSCEVYLSRGPVYLQHDGAAVCGRCFTPKRPATRNKQYEATAKMLRFPCKNRELGCLETVPYVEETEVIAHEEVCEHRQYVCPVLGSAHCDWLGPRAAMVAHCRAQHPDSVLDNPCTLTHDIGRSSLHNYIITAFQLLFLLHTKVCVTTGKIFHSVTLLAGATEAEEFLFSLEVKRGDELLLKEGRVAPQGCLAIQEDTSLALSTNSLLDILGGFDITTFTVRVKRKFVETCAGCKTEVTVFRYRNKEGWHCERCAPAMRGCENQAQGCTHTDIDWKCWKHEVYFCQQMVIYCFLCSKKVSRGSLSAHYDSAHREFTHAAGSTWRATQTEGQLVRGRLFGELLFGGRHCLMSTAAAGIAVCYYWLDDTQFHLKLHIPLSSERLSEFRCSVRLTNPTTGDTQTFTPDIQYDENYDWRISVKKEEFPSWNREFDVSVNITKC